MTNRALYTWLLINSVLAAPAFNHWYDQPVVMDPGLTVIDEISAPVDAALIHARASVGEQGGCWGLVWDYQDDANLKRIILDIAPSDRYEAWLQPEVRMRIEQIDDGAVTISESALLSRHISPTGFNSIKIVYSAQEATVYVGNDEEAVATIVSSPSEGAIGFYCTSPTLCQRLQSEHTETPVEATSTLTDMGSLEKALAGSTDPIEGFWRYLDRNVATAKATLGGMYTLAIVRNGDGYDIVYISGAQDEASSWSTLDLKGRLRPTIFTGNYDLEWLTSDRHLLDTECNAQLSVDNAVLTLRFPLLDSQIRFSKLPH